MAKIIPNFFIVGGPKCGTTAMVEFLRTHPNIFISEPKEPNYFADDMPKMKFVDTEKDYFRLFQKVSNEKIIADASIFYMFSEIAIKNIYDLNPNAKLLVMLRNPLDMVPSFHKQILYTLDEDTPNFHTALKLENERLLGNNIPKHCRSTRLLEYSQIAKYGKQLENIFKYFSREQVKLIMFEDFVNSNKSTYLEVLNFLNIPDDGKSNFTRVNDAKKAKSKIINKIVNRPPKFAKTIAKFTRKVLNKPRLGILNTIDHLNRDKLVKTPLTESEKQMLINLYKEDIKQTQLILNKDLNHWLN